MDLWNESNSHLQQLKDFVPRGAMLVSVEVCFVFVGVDFFVAKWPMEIRLLECEFCRVCFCPGAWCEKVLRVAHFVLVRVVLSVLGLCL